ncbi:phospholipase D-like domain-containing protein [Marinicellulosiphila megalodicopiae]|uniref:phospholipase D-like domain-containing protein n=1 Tax=Marinicellulosiphila megalodicopiae TaxID=2724896 RepID=UPI003BAEF0E2
MIFWIFSISLSLVTSSFLLKKTYLKETSIGWLLAIWAVPFAGSIIYLTMVIRRKSERHQHNEAPHDHVHKNETLVESAQILESIGITNGFLAYDKLEEHTVLRDDEFIPALLKQVEQAKHSILICTYILSGDAKEALITRLYEANERGVEIYLLVDRIGSGLLLSSKNRKEYLGLPFKTVIFRESLLHSLLYIEKRLHSKLAIFDETTGIIGSHNIRDETISTSKKFARNISVLVKGNVVEQMKYAFIDLYEDATGERFEIQNESDEHHGHEENEVFGKNACPARITFSDPIAQDFQYNDYLNSLFFSAQKRMYIWMPYMIPSDILRTSIINAHKTGVDVKVLIPEISDSKLVDNAHQLILNELTDNHVPCAVSTGEFDHTKIIIIDDVAVIGSTNLDLRSLFRNYEANIEVNDEKFSDEISELFLETYNQAKLVECTTPKTGRTIINQLTSLIASLY